MKSLTILFFFIFCNPTSQANSPTVDLENIEETNTYVEFTLRNESAKSIPLIIPGVMNPNLSPMSNSGVNLKVGQEILYKYKGKKRVLLVVSEDLEGQTLIVNKLLKEAKKKLDS